MEGYVIYRPPKQNNQFFLDNLSPIADHYSRIYGSYTILEYVLH